MSKNSVAVVLAAFLLATIPPAAAGEDGELVSTMSLMAAVSSAGGIRIAPAAGVTPRIYTEDLAPSQVLEIIRPDMGPITVGRLNSSCSCVRASMPKRSYAAGERALIEIRNVKATPRDGATYAVFVQLTSPVREVLQYDIFVKSGAPGPAASVPSQSGTSAPAQTTTPRPPPFKYEDVTPYPPRPAPAQ